MASHGLFAPDLFAGQTHVVSGGGTGIGRAIARELAGLGATVILCSRRAEHLEPTVAEIEAMGGRAEALPCNVRDPEAVGTFFGEVSARHGHIHGLVNNAGGQYISPAEEITAKGWHAVVETNLTGAFHMSQAAFRTGMREHGGAIVNVVMEMWTGMPGMAHSGAARAAVANLTQTLAQEWGQFGVRVNAVAPGLIATGGMRNYGSEVVAHLERVAREIPAGRMGTEREVAAATIFLLSPGASFISGATLRVDGGGTNYRFRAQEEHTPWRAVDDLVETEPGTDD